VKADYKYWKQLAAFAYGSYLDYGNGVVQIREQPAKQLYTDEINELFNYFPFDPDNDDIPMDAVEMIAEYDPEKEVILMIVDAKGQKICMQLSAEKLSVTPLEAYKALYGKFIPGRVYQLVKVIDDIQPGYYIYEREYKAILIFHRAGMDKDGDICQTDEIVRVHLDYRDWFLETEMKVRIE